MSIFSGFSVSILTSSRAPTANKKICSNAAFLVKPYFQQNMQKTQTQSKFYGKRFPGIAVVRNTHCTLNVWWERQGRDPRSDELLISHSAISPCNKLHARHAGDGAQLFLPVRMSSLASPASQSWLWHFISNLLFVRLVPHQRMAK